MLENDEGPFKRLKKSLWLISEESQNDDDENVGDDVYIRPLCIDSINSYSIVQANDAAQYQNAVLWLSSGF